MAAVIKALYGIQIILTDTNAHNLLALLQTIDTSLGAVQQNCQSLRIQAANSNGGNVVYMGDSLISATGTLRYGYELLAHDQIPYVNVAENVPLADFWVQASAQPSALNIEITFG